MKMIDDNKNKLQVTNNCNNNNYNNNQQEKGTTVTTDGENDTTNMQNKPLKTHLHSEEFLNGGSQAQQQQQQQQQQKHETNDTKQQSKNEQYYANKFLLQAHRILKDIDEAYIVTHRNHTQKILPLFRPEEITLGSILGTGGFGVVNEITKFTLDRTDDDDDDTNDKLNEFHDPLSTTNPTMKTSAIIVLSTKEEEEEDREKTNDQHLQNVENDVKMLRIMMARTPTRIPKNTDHHYVRKNVSSIVATATTPTTTTTTNTKPTTTNTNTTVVQTTTTTVTTARYALKRLRPDLNKLELARGMVDLAVEAKFLSVVTHPNIIKIRGMAQGPMIDKDFFIILDRLCTTLDQEIIRWKDLYALYQRTCPPGRICSPLDVVSVLCCGGGAGADCCGLLPKSPWQRHKVKCQLDLLIERLTVAYDLAAAFFYLHENKIVYRDIKPQNIGFDFRGDVKVFDFGLCKSLSPKLKANDSEYGYKLTGRAGSLPYMAPEVIQMETYDTKCDVYSFAILLWELLALQPAHANLSPIEFIDKIVVQKQRMRIPNDCPPLTRLLIPEAWDANPRQRPDMKRVAIIIRADLNTLSTDETIYHRTDHMVNRSNHSIRDRSELLVPLTEDAS